MLSSLPCVSTNVGDAKYIIGDSGWLVENFDGDNFAMKIHEA